MTASTDRRTCLFRVAGLACAAALTGSARGTAAQTLAELKNRGLKVGLLVDFPPYGTLDARGHPDGYDADVAHMLARDLGLELSLLPVTGPNRVSFLLARKVDLLIASLPVTPERARQVAFSRPYSVATILVYGRRKAAINGTADLKHHRTGVVRGSAADVAVTTSAPRGSVVRRFDDEAALTQALISGQVDAIACAPPLAAQITARAPADVFGDRFVLRHQEMAMAVRTGQDEWLGAVNGFIARRLADGELDQLYRKWLMRELVLSR